jgi:uncharacterized protein
MKLASTCAAPVCPFRAATSGLSRMNQPFDASNKPEPSQVPLVRANSELEGAAARLGDVLDDCGEIVVAVSGGVDSLTLATFAHERLAGRAAFTHAVSPAVPLAATERVRAWARDRRASLTVLDAHEFTDEAYRSNPANRCYFCKSHLYDALRARFACVILSGANLDDLSDYRPGLLAARERGVRHPFVEARITKVLVRELARSLGLGEIAELPSAPCLSSRVETGLRIEASALAFVDAVETDLRRALVPRIVRCRIRHRGVTIELDEAALKNLGVEDRRMWQERISAQANERGLGGDVDFEAYRQGSAFLRPVS